MIETIVLAGLLGLTVGWFAGLGYTIYQARKVGLSVRYHRLVLGWPFVLAGIVLMSDVNAEVDDLHMKIDDRARD